MFTRQIRFIPIALVLGSIFLLLVAGACTSSGEEPTLRPTYTPYPTLAPLPTATPRPTYTPYPTSDDSAVESTRPSSTPSKLFEVGKRDVFLGGAWTAIEKGLELFDAGEYEAAIESFKKAQQHHGKPSGALENRIALAYDELGMKDLAIEHYSNSIAIGDSASDGVNRALSYTDIDRCDLAIEDAKIALTLEPESAPGYHSDVEANTALYLCYFFDDNKTAALQHVDAALSLAEEHSYSAIEIADISEARDQILGN